MAYTNQDKKKKIAENLKKVLKGTGIKYTLGVHNYSTIVMKIKSGPVDFIGNYIEVVSQKPLYARTFDPNMTYMRVIDPNMTYMRVNDYHYRDQFSGKALELLNKIIPTLNEGNHDRSDMQSDYFDVGWYLNVSIGEYGKPYKVTK